MVSYIGDPSILDEYQLLPRQNTPGIDLGAVGQSRPNDKFLGPGTNKLPPRPPTSALPPPSTLSDLSISALPTNPSLFPRRPPMLAPYAGGGIGNLFSQLAYMDPERFDTSMQRFQTFRDRYGNMMGPGGYRQQMGLFNTLGRLNPEQFDLGMQRLQTYQDLFQPSYGGPISSSPGFPTPTGPKPPFDVPTPEPPPMMDGDGVFGGQPVGPDPRPIQPDPLPPPPPSEYGGGKQAPIDVDLRDRISDQFPGFNPGSANLDPSGNVLPEYDRPIMQGPSSLSPSPSPYRNQPVNPMQSQSYFGGFGSPRNPYASGYGMGYQPPPPPYMPMTGRVGYAGMNPMGRMGYGAFGGGGYYSPSASSPSGGKGGGMGPGPGQAYMGGSGGGKGGAA